MNFVARRWTLSSVSMLVTVWDVHTWLAYPDLLRTKGRYKILRTWTFGVLEAVRRMKPSIEFAFDVVFPPACSI